LIVLIVSDKENSFIIIDTISPPAVMADAVAPKAGDLKPEKPSPIFGPSEEK
jgi:hypothetical protein